MVEIQSCPVVVHVRRWSATLVLSRPRPIVLLSRSLQVVWCAVQVVINGMELS
jgi:hypothetical protein